jgi:hypothetical protein
MQESLWQSENTGWIGFRQIGSVLCLENHQIVQRGYTNTKKPNTKARSANEREVEPPLVQAKLLKM